MIYTLSDLGWSAHFMMQLSIEALESQTPARIIAVHKTRYDALSQTGPCSLWLKPDAAFNVTVGDWVLTDQSAQILQRLERQTTLQRRSAGGAASQQLIAANIDVMFITTSCNHDFNLARLERYLVLAKAAGCLPVIVLTKPDLCDTPQDYENLAQSLGADIPVLTVNVCDPSQALQLTDWWRKGQTAALLGSSGVGKSTLTASLTGQDITAQSIRDQDAKGRHTTTARNMYQATHGGWLMDTPGMRALRLTDVTEGIEAVFADLAERAEHCRFSNCSHVDEPGCAIQADIAAGTLSPSRLHRWQKLEREDRRNSETLAQSRHREKAVGKYHKRMQGEARGRKNR